MKTKTRPGGFTLVEILLALAILSTILVLLLSSFTGAGRGLEVLTDRSGSFRQLRITMDRMGSDLEGAFSSIGAEATAFTCRQDQFSGKPSSTLIFTAYSLPDVTGARPTADLVKIKYFPKISDDGRFIELHREQSDLPLLENKIPTSESRLASRLLGFRVELFDGTKWQKEWPPEGGGTKWALPKKVSLVVTDSLGQEFRRTILLPLAGQEASGIFSGKRGTVGSGTPPTGIPPPPRAL
jgi:prepilin-type N-terminal cleavage/methylation domain-containing protein